MNGKIRFLKKYAIYLRSRMTICQSQYNLSLIFPLIMLKNVIYLSVYIEGMSKSQTYKYEYR
jgi:hypothetical protein